MKEKNNEVFELTDDQLDAIAGGSLHQNGGVWEVIDSTGKTVYSHSNKSNAIAYAKRFGISTDII